MRKLKRYYMSRFTRRQRKRLKRIFRNAALRGSVLGALLMMVIPAQVMGGTKSAVVMCGHVFARSDLSDAVHRRELLYPVL